MKMAYLNEQRSHFFKGLNQQDIIRNEKIINGETITESVNASI